MGVSAAGTVPGEELCDVYLAVDGDDGALEPFRSDAMQHDVPVLPYLQQGGQGAFDITVECCCGRSR